MKELFINAEGQKIGIAILEDGKLSELYQKNFSSDISVGDLYIGTIKKELQGLNAIIIDIGHKKYGFLHYNDIGTHISEIIQLLNNKINIENLKTSVIYNKNKDESSFKKSIDNVLSFGQKILVQIIKEPISNKGPRLTTKICIPGRNLILVPFSNGISVSKKIKSIQEKNRLIYYINKIKPINIGIIIRTSAVKQIKKHLNQELIFLMEKWKNILKKIKKATAPIKIFEEKNKTNCLLRDSFNEDYKFIYCNNEILCQEIYSYLSIIDPKKTKIIKYYKDKTPIFEKYGIEKQIKIFLGKNVPLENGAYIVIEHTEALHVIDVNSGISNNKEKEYSEIKRIKKIFEINLLAAKEIIRQFKLRDMGGIIIVDFIDMKDYIQKNKLYEYIKKKMKNDKAKHKILPPNEFGLVQFTRQRKRPELKILKENFTKKNYSATDYIYHIEFLLKSILKNYKKIQLHINIFVSSHLKKGFPSLQHKWFFKYKKWINIIPRKSFRCSEYKIIGINLNKKEKEIISSSKFYCGRGGTW